MNDRSTRLTDTAIERALARRAPHGADRALLGDIVAIAAKTPQRRSWWPRLAPVRMTPRIAFAVLALVLALALGVGGLIAGGLGPNVPTLRPTVVPAAVSSPSGPSPDPASPSATPSSGRCSTDTVAVLTGDSMPQIDSDAASLPGLGTGRGVFITRSQASSGGDVWAVGGTRHTATRIASVSGVGLNVLDVLDISPDGSLAILRVGTMSPSGANPECADLYLVPTDRSPATRLTTFGAGGFVVGGSFSPGGTRVAYATWTNVSVADLSSHRHQVVDQSGCPAGYGLPGKIAWSPGIDRFAVGCARVEIFDPTGASAPVVVTPIDAALDFGWQDGTHLLRARQPSDATSGGLFFDSFDTTTGVSSALGEVYDRGIDWEQPSAGGFAPDGRLVLATGYRAGSAGGSVAVEVGYVLQTAGAPAAPILSASQLLDAAWTADSQSIVYVDTTDPTQPILGRVDGTMAHTRIGFLPPTYAGGVWRLP